MSGPGSSPASEPDPPVPPAEGSAYGPPAEEPAPPAPQEPTAPEPEERQPAGPEPAYPPTPAAGQPVAVPPRRHQTRALKDFVRHLEDTVTTAVEPSTGMVKRTTHVDALVRDVRRLESADEPDEPARAARWIMIGVALAALALVALMVHSYLGVVAERKRKAAEAAALAAEHARRAAAASAAIANRIPQRDQGCEKLYAEALAMIYGLGETPDRVVLQQAADRLRVCVRLASRHGGWPRLGDACHLLGRVHFYWAWSDQSGDVLETIRKDHAANAGLMLRRAAVAYQREGAVTRFALEPRSWWPEVMEPRRFRPPGADRELRCETPAQARVEAEAFAAGIRQMYR